MNERRPLVAGLKPAADVDTTREKEFVYGEKAKEPSPPKPAQAAEPRDGKAAQVGRVPLTTRIRGNFAAALKRASLERQLNNEFPNTLQDILEEALEPWLRDHGYLE